MKSFEVINYRCLFLTNGQEMSIKFSPMILEVKFNPSNSPTGRSTLCKNFDSNESKMRCLTRLFQFGYVKE